MVVMARLTDDEIAAALANLPGWAREGDTIVKTFELPTFPAAIAVVGEIAERAEAANHHPDLDIRYRRLRVALSTHDAGGITEKDVALATEIEALAEAAQ
jgi:4a-hydroxytetrahydrobiopterin dehydratase